LSIATEEYTVDERAVLKRTLAQYLSPVGDAKTLVFANDLEKQYLVKFAGKIDLAEHNPSWMQFVLPFKSATSFIKGSFEEVQVGSGTITNVGNEPAPLTIEIAGPVTNPSVVVGTYTLTYAGTINTGSTLIIDVEAMTVELDGVNAVPDYAGGFPWLSVGNTNVTAASAGTTTFKYRGRWL
jgi:phage-related protein